jgi:UDP-2,3-diacylglucosamine hydrolase
VERRLGLMCGAGVLPARMAAQARHRGWRVVAFTFEGADGVGEGAEAVVAARMVELGAVLERLVSDDIASVLFSGRFSMPDVLRVHAPDDTFRSFEARARSRSGAAFVDAIIGTLAARGISVLDQRDFVGDWLVGPGCCSARQPTEAEWSEARAGLAAARAIAGARIGQTVVMRHGAVVAAEAVEGTTETVRRGAALAGPGAVVVKAVAADHDYRFDAPAIGPETLAAAASAGITLIAVEANRVLLFERAEALRIADAAGVAVAGVEGP